MRVCADRPVQQTFHVPLQPLELSFPLAVFAGPQVRGNVFTCCFHLDEGGVWLDVGESQPAGTATIPEDF